MQAKSRCLAQCMQVLSGHSTEWLEGGTFPAEGTARPGKAGQRWQKPGTRKNADHFPDYRWRTTATTPVPDSTPFGTLRLAYLNVPAHTVR